MNTTAHTILSSSIATALALFTFASAAFAGIAASSTILGISLFVGFGVIEIMIQSYTTPASVLDRRRSTPTPARHPAEVVAFTRAQSLRKAA